MVSPLPAKVTAHGTYPPRNIQAVQFKTASWFGNGFIAFTVARGNERQSRPNRQALGASKDENAAPFGLKSKEDFQARCTTR